MIVRYQQLADRIQLEIDELNQLVVIIQRHWSSAKNSADRDAYLNSVAFSLQSFYTGLERIFELVANEFDQAALSDKEWHKVLLALMSQPVQDVRPELLKTATAVQLEEYLRFRHVARNIYATHLNPTKLSPLVEKLPGLWVQLQIELLAFITYLQELANADE
ncbi:MAG: antitoxin [Chloroflexi bacterium]|nr:antitoxin [Ardenticatenaceae bacterium]MBL1130832.1 antitoxin [Chloroflexota bacterium]NOG36929.1 antitoxin [Chloroflexota bacterium]GIK57157.1 MAG: hypothetical protein BroJett015_28200 [Chloroflexota bacterium]